MPKKSKHHLRLAVVLSHPVQYYSPWFREIARESRLDLKVFYLWDSGVAKTEDRTFQTSFSWDIPLLDDYESEFVTNLSRDPGTHHFSGLDNPGLIDAISQWGPDAILIFGYAWKTHLKVLFSPQLRRIPKLLRGDSHDLHPRTGLKATLIKQLKRGILKRFSHCLAVGHANREYLLEHGVAERNITLVPHCVDNARFSTEVETSREAAADWKAGMDLSSDRPVALFAGKFEPKKRPGDLLEAFLKLPHTNTSAAPALLMVGGGPLEAELRRQAGEALGKTVFFAPFQNQSQMPKVYAAGSFIVLPSFGNGETWGLAINEAMNLCLPAIVSSHVGCARDLIIPNETGWIFESSNVSELQSILKEALSDLGKTRKMGHSAKAHIASFSYEEATKTLLSALEGLKDN